MAGKPSKVAKDSQELYDAGRRHVLAEKIQPLPENLKKKILFILEAIPSRSKTEIAEALQSNDYDVDAALNSFINQEDGAIMNNHNEWTVQGKRKNKKKKTKKQQPKENDTGQRVEPNNAVDAESNPSGQQINAKSEQINQQSSPNETTSSLPPDSTSPTVQPLLTNGELKEDPTKPLPVPSSPSSVVSSTVSEKSSPEVAATAKPGQHHGHEKGQHHGHEKHQRVRTHSASSNDFIKRSLKDLQRSSVSISRFQSVLDEDAETSTKALAKTFQTLRQALDEREKLLEDQLTTVIQETKNLLQERQEDAAGLKYKCNRVGTMTEEEAIELRNEIKHFVGERRIDEDLGTTKRFKGDEEQMIEAIKNFGEVTPIKHHYTSYKKLTNPEPVKKKLENKPPPLKVAPTVVENKPKDKNEPWKGAKRRGGRSDRIIVSPSHLKDQAEMHARLQEVVKQQTGTLTSEKNKKVNFDDKTKSKDSTSTVKQNNNDHRKKTNESNHQTTSNQHHGHQPGSSPQSVGSSENLLNPELNGVSQKTTPSPPGSGDLDSKKPTSSNRHEQMPNGEVPKSGSGPSSQSQGRRRTRRHYVRKPGNENGDAFAKNFSNHKELLDNEKTNGEMANSSATINENGLPKVDQNITAVNGADGFNPLPQRQRKTRRVYQKKNPEAEIQFPPPKDSITPNNSS